MLTSHVYFRQIRMSTQNLRLIGARIRELRLRRGMSQRELASSSYDGSFVSQIEAGRRLPSAEALAFFAERLGVTTEELSASVPPSVRLELEMVRQEASTAFDEGHLEQAMQLYRRLEELSVPAGSPDFRAEALLGIGLVEEVTGEVTGALERYARATELAQSEELKIRIQISLGRAYRTAGDLSYSVDILERSLDHARRVGWEAHAVRSAVQLAMSLAERGDHRRTRQVLDSVNEEARLLRDPRTMAVLHWARARNASHLGEAEDALKHLSLARTLMEQQHVTIELARLEGARAYSLIELGRPDEASPLLETSVRVLFDAGATLEAARLQTEHARSELTAGRKENAREIAERALELLRGLQDPLEEAQCALVLALALGTEPRAETLLRSAAQRFEEAGAADQLARALQALAEFYVMTGRRDEGLETYRTALATVVTPVVA